MVIARSTRKGGAIMARRRGPTMLMNRTDDYPIARFANSRITSPNGRMIGWTKGRQVYAYGGNQVGYVHNGVLYVGKEPVAILGDEILDYQCDRDVLFCYHGYAEAAALIAVLVLAQHRDALTEVLSGIP